MRLLRLGRQLLPRRRRVGSRGRRRRASSSRLKYSLRAPPAHGAIAPSSMRQVGVGDDQLGVDLEAGAEAVARRHAPYGRVEREVARRELLEATGRRTGRRGARRTSRSRLRVVVGQVDDLERRPALRPAQRGLQRVGEPALEPSLTHQPVDDDLDRVLLVASSSVGGSVRRVDDSPSTRARAEALRRQLGEQLVVLALAPAHDRRQHLEPGALGELEHAVDDLLRGLAGDRRAAVRAVRHADAGVEQPQVVVDLGDRADGRPRVAVTSTSGRSRSPATGPR